MNDIIFRPAGTGDMDEIMKLQLAVFHGEQKIPADDVPLPPSRKAQWWCAEQNGLVAAAVAAWQEDGLTHWGRFAVQPPLRNQGIGSALARYSAEALFEQGIDAIYLTARESTVYIFRKMGGMVTGEPEPFFEGTVTPVLLRKENYVH